MEYMAKNIPLWQITTWDKNFNNVDKEWQPKTIKYKYLLSDELDSLRVDDGDIRILYTGKDVGYTTEELAGDNISEGEVVSIPWGGIPTVKYHKGKFVTGDNRIATSNDTSKLTNKYLYYYLQGNIGEIASYYRGASLKHPCMKDVLKMTISYPSVQEQEKICSQFDMLEWLIEARKQELQLLDDLIKARFVEMFGDPVSNPKGWDMVELGELTGIGSSKRIFEKEYVSEGIPFYRTKEIVELSKGNSISTELYITEERFAEIKEQYGVPKAGDLLISAVGTIGIIWIVDGKNDFYFKDGNLIRVDSSDKFDSVYMKNLLENLIVEYKKQMSSGTAYAALTISGLTKMKVYDVPMELQNQFADFVRQVDKSKLMYQKLHQKLNILQQKAGDI